ncbi:hypothetical protein HY450_00925 [Candidatus Pacearchaeota archaeon]|nr:hypothetical protein [Candidatus Pacearchaeota archaeon]
MIARLPRINFEYLRSSLEKGQPQIKITPPILRAAGGSYLLFGRKINEEGTEREIVAALSETEFNKLKKLSQQSQQCRGQE